jgi:hypothetical protein
VLTPKQEKFAQEVASGKTQADAYRASYNVKPNTKPETTQKKASLLMKRAEIRGRVKELRKPIAVRAQLTLESHLTDLLELRKRAMEEGQFSAAISAEIARGKASGIYTEKISIETPKLIIRRPGEL